MKAIHPNLTRRKGLAGTHAPLDPEDRARSAGWRGGHWWLNPGPRNEASKVCGRSFLATQVQMLLLCLGLGFLPTNSAKAGEPSSPAPETALRAELPAVFQGLVVANAVFSLGTVLAVALLWRDRRTLATHVQSAIGAQTPVLTQAVVERLQPKLEAFTEQGQGVVRQLELTAQKNEEVLRSMEDQHTRHFANIKKNGDAVINDALHNWQAQAEAMMAQLQKYGTTEFRALFEAARSSWRTELTSELDKIKENWNTALKPVAGQQAPPDRAQADERARTEMEALKQQWQTQIQELDRQWQQRLSQLLEQVPAAWQKGLETAANKAVDVCSSRVDQLSAATSQGFQKLEQNLAEAKVRAAPPEGAPAEAARRVPQPDELLSSLAWPPFFRDGLLAKWRERIEAKIATRDAGAFDLFLSLGRFNNATRDAGDRRKLAEALHLVSVDAYRFWKSSGSAPLDAALEWRAAFQAFLDSAGIPLDIILALERDRFDMSSMLSADAGSGTRMYVKEAFSWIVRDRSGETPKVLCHARVNTC